MRSHGWVGGVCVVGGWCVGVVWWCVWVVFGWCVGGAWVVCGWCAVVCVGGVWVVRGWCVGGVWQWREIVDVCDDGWW